MKNPPRKSSRTRNVLGKIERMCELLMIADRTMSELADELCASCSTARNYALHLKAADLIEVIGEKKFAGGSKHDLLRIKRDPVAIAAMLKSLQEQPSTANLKGLVATSKKKALAKDKTRHVHKMKDDAPWLPKIAPAEPPGRHWTDKAMFGDGPAPSLLFAA